MDASIGVEMSESMQMTLQGHLQGIWGEPASASSTISSATSTTTWVFASLQCAQSYGGPPLGDETLLWMCTTSTTSSVTHTADLVRDEVNRALVHGSPADVQDLLRRLLDRQRRLRHMDRLLGKRLKKPLNGFKPASRGLLLMQPHLMPTSGRGLPESLRMGLRAALRTHYLPTLPCPSCSSRICLRMQLRLMLLSLDSAQQSLRDYGGVHGRRM